MEEKHEPNVNMIITIKSKKDGDEWDTEIVAPKRAEVAGMLVVLENSKQQLRDLMKENEIPESLFNETEFQDIMP